MIKNVFIMHESFAPVLTMVSYCQDLDEDVVITLVAKNPQAPKNKANRNIFEFGATQECWKYRRLRE